MADTSPSSPRSGDSRPGANMRLIEATQYRLPPAALVSILHRVSGMLMAILLPFVVWLFDKSVSSEASYDAFAGAFSGDFGVLFKLVALALIWAYLHHATAGIRHLWMDATHSVTKEKGRSSALVTFAISLVLTVLLAAKLFGLF